MLLGAGSKAGLVPLHVWLPLAHPAAPSHVSALMSGVMTKVAIYGFIRVIFDLLGPPTLVGERGRALPRRHHRRPGHPLRLDGEGSEAAARLQHDRKHRHHLRQPWPRAGLPGQWHELAAALALTAALFHVLNHSFFKSLLFFGAGAVLTATGERDMDKLGGLIHRMPLTSFVFLVGCVAISALPPLNGFVSEWLTFQAMLQSPDLPQWALKIMVPAVGAHAGAVGGAGRGLFRQGLRRDLSRPAAQHGGGNRARSRSLLARGHVRSSPRFACWPASCRDW